ncbi:hypothetical protein Ga0074812_13379 [Parafrankia irregularis]|uniref:Uncharacterized protein n=1 Tax=Parafrankia irregularis TaxID=795642 RepID=A0A0S4QWT8_9ACTN|nr:MULTISPECIES: hypothetical protein [Parafrankia]MBE3206501.1 hypothetical protein [Parafrankia sp. CH37]CUU59955.1 hypothetical protein Ga0074812_13379 [Parafrankia irregularis]
MSATSDATTEPTSLARRPYERPSMTDYGSLARRTADIGPLLIFDLIVFADQVS